MELRNIYYQSMFFRFCDEEPRKKERKAFYKFLCNYCPCLEQWSLNYEEVLRIYRLDKLSKIDTT